MESRSLVFFIYYFPCFFLILDIKSVFADDESVDILVLFDSFTRLTIKYIAPGTKRS